MAKPVRRWQATLVDRCGGSTREPTSAASCFPFNCTHEHVCEHQNVTIIRAGRRPGQRKWFSQEINCRKCTTLMWRAIQTGPSQATGMGRCLSYDPSKPPLAAPIRRLRCPAPHCPATSRPKVAGHGHSCTMPTARAATGSRHRCKTCCARSGSGRKYHGYLGYHEDGFFRRAGGVDFPPWRRTLNDPGFTMQT
ncbi:MAG: hypothetical protein ACI83P_001041 [Janthinobacterium sp.]|jgi:hypothetical protein